MKSFECSFYENTFDRIGEIRSIDSILTGIKAGEWAEPIKAFRTCKIASQKADLKKKLPCFTISGIFAKRLASEVVEYNRHIILDFDHLDRVRLKLLWNFLVKDKYISCMFLSPSMGLKLAVEVTSGADEHKMIAFEQVKAYFTKMYSLVADKACKDICRLCYVSYDPNLFISDNNVPFEVVIPDERQFREAMTRHIDVESDIHSIFRTAKRFANKHGQFTKGNRNNYVHNLSCILNRAGVSKDVALSLIQREYGMDKEFEIALNGVYLRNKWEFGSRPIFVTKMNGLFE